MRFFEVLTRVLHWRWLPFVLPVSFTLLFVGMAVLFVPESLEGSGDSNEDEAETGKPTGKSQDSATGIDSTDGQPDRLGGANRSPYKSRLPSASRGSSSRTSHTPHNARVTLPRTGPGASYVPPKLGSRAAAAALPASPDEVTGPADGAQPTGAADPIPLSVEPAPAPAPTF